MTDSKKKKHRERIRRIIEEDPFTVQPSMAICSECGGQLRLLVWGEGIDSSIECEECDEKDIYR